MWDSPITSAIAKCAETHLTGRGPIVDLGCGTALVSGLLQREVIGVDTSARMLERAEQEQRIARAVLATADSTGLAAGDADDVLICNLLHLHPEPSLVIQEADRICSPSGRIFMCWPIDGLTTSRMLRLDIASGRPIFRSLLADGLRRLAGAAFVMAGARRTPSTHIENAIDSLATRPRVAGLVVQGCQRIVVLGARAA